jgi:asparagine synthase (glutamine-hydrolysing)
MCGIAGILCGKNNVTSETLLRNMAKALHHRGPDASAIWHDPKAGIGFAHARLSILDLSKAGSQPMHSPSQRFVMSFNGEIYNHNDLRNEMKHVSWKGHSDTETILAGIDSWGVSKTIQKCEGMFAIAIWDRKERKLYLIRDRVGEKPLYYGHVKGDFIFGSELRAMKLHERFSYEIDKKSMTSFFKFGYIPGENSIYKSVKKLSPGTILEIHQNGDMQKYQYWSIKLDEPQSNSREMIEKGDYVDKLNGLLSSSVKKQMISDVPIGAFLSGGIDSSIIVALMQSQSISKVRTFTIGFEQQVFNEADHAKKIANHLNTDHSELILRPQDALDVVPLIQNIYDEPFSDASQIPTYLLSKFAKQSVTVSLSGDGGDELFGGYERYFRGVKMWRYLSVLPVSVRNNLSKGISSVSEKSWNQHYSKVENILPNRFKVNNLGYKLHKFARLSDSPSFEQYVLRLVSHVNSTTMITGDQEAHQSVYENEFLYSNQMEKSELMMFLDINGFLPDDILVKVDRAAMAVSLETRIPFLDHKIVEFATNLPLRYKISGGKGKTIVRDLLKQYVPEHMYDRSKQGFSVPIDSWLRGPLRDWAETLLNRKRLEEQGLLNTEWILNCWSNHIKGEGSYQYHLWDILMFQSWLDSSQNPSEHD